MLRRRRARLSLAMKIEPLMGHLMKGADLFSVQCACFLAVYNSLSFDARADKRHIETRKLMSLQITAAKTAAGGIGAEKENTFQLLVYSYRDILLF
jgi:hypothetical protein